MVDEGWQRDHLALAATVASVLAPLAVPRLKDENGRSDGATYRSTVNKARLWSAACQSSSRFLLFLFLFLFLEDPAKGSGGVTDVSLRLRAGGASKSELFSPTRAVMDPDSFIVTTTKHGLDEKTATTT
jgi:hypothetical protein